MQRTFAIRTAGPGLYDFNREVARFVRESEVREGADERRVVARVST